MKRSVLIALILLPFMITSCKKDKPLSETMIGKWEAEYVTTFLYKNNVLSKELKSYLNAGDVVFQINDGGTGKYTEAGNDYLFSWTMSGTSLTLTNLLQQPVVLELSIVGDNLLWAWPVQTDSQDATVTYQDIFTGKRL